jgi:hypothetical protein
MKLLVPTSLGLLLMAASPLWSQSDTPTQTPPASTQVNVTSFEDSSTSNSTSDQMLTPPLVSGQNFPTALTSEMRSNYLRGGINFTTAYNDNASQAPNGTPVSDINYFVSPNIAWDQATSRLHWTVNYSPGFTFYQRASSRDEADQNVALNFSYRLSPHLTFTASDNLQKSGDAFSQPDGLPSNPVSGGTQDGNFSVIAPVADMLRNSGNVGLNYQFALNGMVGASGSFSNLHYPNSAQVPGLFDSASQGGSLFYSLRVSKMHYIGVTYQYSRLLSYPTDGTDETQTHAILFFYTLYPSSRLSVTFFGGPQHSNSVQPPPPPPGLPLPAAKAWTPAAGASMNWQGRLNSFALSYSHIISGGGGLVGAVRMDSASLSFRQQITKTISGSVAGAYTQNDVLAGAIPGTNSGHTLSASASLQKQVGQHLNLQAGYTRLHQDYSNVAVLASTPNTNREYVSLSYQFSRPLGR